MLIVARYKLASHVFASPLRTANIVKAVGSSNLSSSPEMCGLLTTPEVGYAFSGKMVSQSSRFVPIDPNERRSTCSLPFEDYI